MSKPCYKVCYRTRSDAKKAKRDQNRKKGWHLTDVYFCDRCSAWHCTSLPKKKSRRIKHGKNKKP